LPGELLAHPKISGKTFYALPQELINSICTYLPLVLSSDEIRFEEHAACAAKSLPNCVGFHNGESIIYHLLEERKPAAGSGLSAGLLIEEPIDPQPAGSQACLAKHTSIPTSKISSVSNAEWDRLNPQQQELALGTLDGRLTWAHRVAQAYCGWLLTNRMFLAEDGALYKKHQDLIVTYGYPKPTPFSSIAQAKDHLADVQHTDPIQEYGGDVRAFCVRWGLDTVAARFLPLPTQPQVPVGLISRAAQSMAQIYIPKTYVLPGADEVREMIDDAVSLKSHDTHLAGWATIANTSNANKSKQIEKLARVFRVQHYWRALQDRYDKQLERKKTGLIAAFANFLHVSEETMKTDVSSIEATYGGSAPIS